jgi:hypothetical protein
MQNVGTMIRRPVPVGTAAASGLLAFVAGAVIALGVPAVVTGLSVSRNADTTVAVPGIGGEQIAHDRSEQGLGGSSTVGGQQIAHNRDEGGMGGK